MVYEYNKIISASELSLLRESVGWNRMEKELSNPIMNSYCNIAVYDENELVGYIDCVSNGVTDAAGLLSRVLSLLFLYVHWL